MEDAKTKALRKLSKAFVACKKADLCFVGCDDNILGFNNDEYVELSNSGLSSFDIREQLNYYSVDDHSTHRDSGAS